MIDLRERPFRRMLSILSGPGALFRGSVLIIDISSLGVGRDLWRDYDAVTRCDLFGDCLGHYLFRRQIIDVCAVYRNEVGGKHLPLLAVCGLLSFVIV